MTCELVHEALLERSLQDLDDLMPHLERCPRCRAWLADLQEAEAALAQALDDFERGGDFEAAFARASAEAPVPLPTSTRRWSTMLVLAAALALTALAVPPQPRLPDPEVLVPPPLAQPASEALANSECSSLDDLAGPAIIGDLTSSQLACLEDLFERSRKQRAQISPLLLAQAWASKDYEAWERLVQRHLEEVDPQDADMAYKYALYLSREGLPRAEDVIHWCEVALANAERWDEQRQRTRLAGLYKMRATARLTLWQGAEEANKASPTPESAERARQARKATADAARDWLLFTKLLGIEEEGAARICKLASVDPRDCEP